MPLSASAVLITSSLGNIANLIPITPGSLGVFDTVMIQVPQIFGLVPPHSKPVPSQPHWCSGLFLGLSVRHSGNDLHFQGRQRQPGNRERSHLTCKPVSAVTPTA